MFVLGPFCFVLIFLLTSYCGAPLYVANSIKPKLLIVLLDGFRWDYVLRQYHDLPGFSQFYSDGSVAEWVKPLFPSVSYPSWTTLLTGLYAENHGILGNNIYDKVLKKMFVLDDHTSTKDPIWWSKEPIWTTATKQGLNVADIQWSRCEIKYDGVLPKFCEGWSGLDGVPPLRSHFNRAQEYFLSGYDLVLVYGEYTDTVGHNFGPESKMMKDTVKDYDTIFVELFQNLTKNGLNQVNIIVISDHGMTDVGSPSAVKMVYLEDYTDMKDILIIMNQGSLMQIFANDGKAEAVYQQLKYMTGVDVYRAKDIPEKYHYRNNKRVADILIVARPGNYVAELRSQLRPELNGYHGYDFDMPDMRSIFFAKGPAFKRNFTLPHIRIEDIYQVYSKVLNITPQPHNGTWENVKNIFVKYL